MLERLESERHAASGYDGFHFDGVVRLRPWEDPCFARFTVSDTFRVMWNAEGQTLRWEDDFDSALQDLALIALGQFLDDSEIPEAPAGSEYTLNVPISSYLFDMFTQEPPTDPELAAYVQGKVFWAWKYKAEPAVFESWEARRLRVEVDDFHQAAFPKVGSLWDAVPNGGYKAMPNLASKFSAARGAITNR